MRRTASRGRRQGLTDAPTVAVTGAAGYIGSRIVHQIRATHPAWRVTAIDNFHLPKVRGVGDVEIDDVDVRDRVALEEALGGVDIVMHCAAISGVDDCEQNPDLAFETNVQGTNNVAWCCRKTGAAIVFPFSMAVLGDPETFPVTADLPRTPMNWYGRTKHIGERAVEAFSADAFPAHLLMKSNLFGHHRVGGTTVSKPTVTNFFLECALQGEPLTVYEPGTQARNYVHVKDVADAYLRSAEVLLSQRDAGTTGARTYEIGSDEDPSVLELAELVSDLTAELRGVDAPVELVENPRVHETLVTDFPVDTSRARDELGWSPSHSIEETVRDLLAVG